VKCPECGSETQDVEGPIHEYMISSPGCWKTFGDVLNKEYSDPAYMKVHRLTVDTFACQHVGDDDRRAKQSVIVHLLALHLAIDLKLGFSEIPSVMEAVIKELKGNFSKLSRPDFANVMKVTDVVTARSASEHCRLVTEWANQVWSAWRNEHDRIREMGKRFFERASV
jgi:hypothetical protein